MIVICSCVVRYQSLKAKIVLYGSIALYFILYFVLKASQLLIMLNAIARTSVLKYI